MVDPTAPPSRRLKRTGVLLACIAAALVAGGVIARVLAYRGMQTWASGQAVPAVIIASARPLANQTLTLPGAVQAFNSAPIHARTSGYLKQWFVDIGQPVKAGQLLAEIDTPDLDQQVLQARADLATAQANAALAASTAKRWANLLQQDAVSKQEADEKAGDLAARASAVNASRANLNRLLALEGFKRIVAPFDGVVTSRNTDIGALVGPGATDTALFTVADERRLRIYVNVPQTDTTQLRPGAPAAVKAPEYPGKSFPVTLTRESPAINGQNGTMQAELLLENAAGLLKPGEYVEVSFKLPGDGVTTLVPASAMMFRTEGPVVAVVRRDGRAALRTVTIARDLGTTVEIGSGLAAGDRVIDNPPEALQTGDRVRIVSTEKPVAGHDQG